MSLTTASMSGRSLGGTDQDFVRLLVKGNPADTIAGGFRVGMGNGDATPLYLDSTGLSVVSSGNKLSRLISTSTIDRDVRFGDWEGYLMPVKRAVLASDTSSTSTTQAAVSSFSVAVEASGVYWFDMILLFTSAATGTGIKLAPTGPAEINFVTYSVSHISANAVGTGSGRTFQASAWASEFVGTDSPAASTVFPVFVKGYFTTTGSAPTSQVGLTIATEVNASQITLKAGSEIIVTKRN